MLTENQTTARCIGMDEKWCEWYICEKCGEDSIMSHFRFCPTCGRDIDEKTGVYYS